MNSVLKEILETRKARNGSEEVALIDEMDPEEGKLIDRAFQAVKPTCSVEVGFTFGISTLYACDALKANGNPCRHIIMNPNQTSGFRGLDLANIQRADFLDMIERHERGSEIVLPQLFAEGLKVQAAIIVGWHTFDHTLVDFFYINKMLEVGGVVTIDDTFFPSISQLVDHILTYPCYEMFGSTPVPSIIGKPELRTRVRRELAKRTGARFLKRQWDYNGVPENRLR
jgi:hypothetical protein